MRSTAILEAIDLSKSFGRMHALQGLNLSVNAGEVVCLLGANGAGKTTTLGLFLGFLAPSSGIAAIDGKPVHEDIAAARARLAYVPEVVSLYPTLSGIETLRYFNDLAGRAPLNDEAARALLGASGLDADSAVRRVGSYSKGMRQKVGLAIALVKKAPALLLDEPLSGLDPSAANELVERIKAMSAAGLAVLMATHDIFRAHDVADRLCVMRKGRLVATIQSKDLTAAAAEELYLDYMRSAA